MSTSSREQVVFQAIQSGAFKNAHQLITKLLKKSPNNYYYKSINSYVIFLLGRKDEGIKLAIDIMNSKPNDLQAIKFLHSFFRDHNYIKESNLIFENAIKAYPNSYELINEWHDVNLNELNIRNLQKSSVYLQKMRGSREEKRDLILTSCFNYYLVSNLKDASALEKKLFPQLGLKLIDSVKPLTTAQEVFVEVSLLKQLNQDEKIVQVIDGFKTYPKMDLDLQIIYLESLSKSNQNLKLFEYCLELVIKENFDDYDTWIYFFDVSVKLNKLNEFIESVKTFETKNPNSRNVKLIQIHILNDDSNEQEDNFEPYKNYLLKFGVKNCAFYDIRSFFTSKSFNKEKFFNFLNNDQYTLLKIDDLINKNSKPSLNQITWLVNLQKFKAYFRKTDLLSLNSKDEEFKNKFLNDNIKYYNLSKSLLTEKLDTDYFIGNEFLFLNLQIYLSNKGHDYKSILSSIVILEFLLQTDKHEFHLKLWLIVLYRQLNSFRSAMSIYKSLSIKSMQHDTLDYYIYNNLSLTFPKTNDILIRDFLKDINQVYNQESQFNYLIYYLSIAYSKKSFSKIEDMILFINRLQNSSSRYLALLEELEFNKITKGSMTNFKRDLTEINRTYLEIDTIEFFDNRDFKTIWEYGFSEELDSISENFEFFSKRDQNNSEIFIKLKLIKNVLICNSEKSADDLSECSKKYQNLYEESIGGISLTAMESLSLKIVYLLCQFINEKNKKFLNEIKEIYLNEEILKIVKSGFSKNDNELINWKDNQLLILSIEILNDVNKLLIGTDKIMNKFKKDINKIKNYNNNCLKNIREFKDDLSSGSKTSNEKVLAKYEQEIEESKLIKELKIERKLVRKIFNNIKEDYNDNFLLYKVV